MNSLAAPLTQLTQAPPTVPLHDPCGYTKNIWLENLKTDFHFSFFLKILDRTIDSIQKKIYTNFDAQTTSNCCHGLSILVRGLILHVDKLDLEAIRGKSYEASHDIGRYSHFIESLPGPLIDLMSSYLLCWIVEIDPVKGRRTTPRKLKDIEKIGIKLCEVLSKKLQRKISNIVANSYEIYSKEVNENSWVDGTQVKMWSEYISEHQLRSDKKTLKYASCIFSMQVSLAYLLHQNALIGIVDDAVDLKEKTLKKRKIIFLRKNFSNTFLPISENELSKLKNQPIIIFAGYHNYNSIDHKFHNYKLQPWIYQFPSLVLACDMHYPQFPSVKDDPNFDSSPIIPTNLLLKEIMEKHRKVSGTSAENPSLYCLSHIFVASIDEVLNELNNTPTSHLPSSLIPFQKL